MMSSTGGNGMQVTVVGGTGFVGSRVCKILTEKGASVQSISKTGVVPKWCQDEEWTSKVTWSAVDLLEATPATLDAAMGSPQAVVSCVGVVGTDPDELKRGNGDANVAVFESSKRVAAKCAAFVSVSDEVAACREGWLPEFFGAYFDGKVAAEAAAADAVGRESLTVIKPSFIYGGDSFGLLPPRVNTAYGSLIDQLLSFGLVQVLADVAPGLIKVALRPPVSVEAVAGACAAAALGEIKGETLDGTKAINAATNPPASTGLTDAIEWTVETAKGAIDSASALAKEQAMKK
jgi:nucleoside-diphosphate-sugar epimerase